MRQFTIATVEHFGWPSGIVDGGRYVRAQAARWSLPTLLLYAGSAAFAQVAAKAVLMTHEFATLTA